MVFETRGGGSLEKQRGGGDSQQHEGGVDGHCHEERRGGGGEEGIYGGEMGMPRLPRFGRQEMIGLAI